MAPAIDGEVRLDRGATLRGRFRGGITASTLQVVVESGFLVGTLEGDRVVIRGTLAGRQAEARRPEVRRRRRLRLALRVGLAVVLVTAATVTTGLGSDYLRLHRQRASMEALEQRVQTQAAWIGSFQHRVAGIRQEVVAWRDLHAQIWEPFGPKTKPPRAESNVGGGAVAARATAAGGSIDGELELLSATLAEQGESLRALARLIARAGRALASLPSRWPLSGAVNSEFGRRSSPWTGTAELHQGIDIGADRGTPVKAPAPGTVVSAGAQGDYGLAVILDHGNGVRSLYAHLQKVLSRSGQSVERGQVIGLSGNTGRSSGPHLHYEVLVNGRAVNPRSFLWDR